MSGTLDGGLADLRVPEPEVPEVLREALNEYMDRPARTLKQGERQVLADMWLGDLESAVLRR